MGYSWPKKKQSKYGAIRTNGMGSKLEAAVYQILKLREKSGAISTIQQQRSVDLGSGIFWKVDFSFFDKFTNQIVWCEAKGFKGERYRICLKLWRDHGPGPLEIYEGNYKYPILKEIVIPKT
jgi:hypothetical protein